MTFGLKGGHVQVAKCPFRVRTSTVDPTQGELHAFLQRKHKSCADHRQRCSRNNEINGDSQLITVDLTTLSV